MSPEKRCWALSALNDLYKRAQREQGGSSATKGPTVRGRPVG